MSHSVPSDSSFADSAFLVGTNLVAFERHDLPIYATPNATLWADAGHDRALYGASVDRVYGETGDVFIASVPLSEEPREIAAAADDPLVALPGLGDGLALPACEHASGLDPSTHQMHAPDVTAVYDFSAPSHIVLPVHDGWGWDLAKPEWFYDHHV